TPATALPSHLPPRRPCHRPHFPPRRTRRCPHLPPPTAHATAQTILPSRTSCHHRVPPPAAWAARDAPRSSTGRRLPTVAWDQGPGSRFLPRAPASRLTTLSGVVQKTHLPLSYSSSSLMQQR
uniref:Uncharacterized protein n=1 Tax=Triticum urartu TaxID=4572 RepID=A0A8R7U741_TRIUA